MTRAEQNLASRFWGQVSEIRRLLAESDLHGKEIAARYGVSASLISGIASGTIRPNGAEIGKRVTRSRPLRPCDPEGIRFLVANTSFTKAQIARQFGVSPARVSHLCRSKLNKVKGY